MTAKYRTARSGYRLGINSALARLLAVMLLLAGSVGAAEAQRRTELSQKVYQLELQIQTLQRYVESLQTAGAAGSSSDSAELRRLIADLTTQLSAVESQLRTVTGRAEQLEFQNRQIQRDLDLLRREFAAQGGAAVAAGTQTAPNPPAGGAPPPGQPAQDAPPAADVALPSASPSEQFQYAFDFIRANDLERGRAAMALFLETDPPGLLKGSAYFWLGRVLLRLDRPAEAARLFLALVDTFPDHEKRPDALYELAQVLISLDSSTEACSALSELLQGSGAVDERLRSRAERLSAEARCNG